MNTGETERLPANLQILAASIIYTLVSFAVFRGMWEINIPSLFLLAVLAFQTATILMGNRGILTSMGAASIAVLLSVAAYFAAVYFLFPPADIVRIAGIAGGAAAAVFILTSSVTSFRAGTFDLEVIEDLQIDTKESEDLFEFDKELEHDLYYPVQGEASVEQADEEILLDDPIDLTEGVETLKIPGDQDRGGFVTGKQPSAVLESNEEANVSYTDTVKTGDIPVRGPSSPEGSKQFQLRSRYRVIEAATGNPLGTYYSDEGYSSIDPVTLGALLDGRAGPGELRIVNLDWSNFDEIEVQVERVPYLSEDREGRIIPAGDPSGPVPSESEGAVSSGNPRNGEPELPKGVTELNNAAADNAAAQRYIIYERRTMRPLGEYVPDGDRPRIDRLTLYRMFPDYDFRSFQIDSIRWLEDEVGIFIKGEKKKDQKL